MMLLRDLYAITFYVDYAGSIELMALISVKFVIVSINVIRVYQKQ